MKKESLFLLYFIIASNIAHCHELYKCDSEILMKKYDSYINVEQYNDALKIIDRCVQENPQVYYLYLVRGETYSYLKEYDKALNDYKNALNLKIDDFDTYYHIYFLYLTTKNKTAALNEIEKIISLFPNNSLGYYERGVSKFYDGKYESAILDFSKAIKINKYYKAYKYRSFCYFKINEYKNAIKDITLYIDTGKAEDDGNAYALRCVSYRFMNKYKKSVKDAYKALAIYKKNDETALYENLLQAINQMEYKE